MILQQSSQKVDRALAAPEFDATSIDMTLPAANDRKGKFLAFNSSTGNPELGPSTTDVTTLASVTSDIATLADLQDGTTTSNGLSTLAGISSNISTVAGISGNVTTVAGKASLITSEFATDMALIDSTFVSKMSLVTSDFVTDMAAVTSDFISDLNTLATADIVSDLNTLATSDIVSDLNQLATSDFVSDLNAIEAIKANVTSVASNISNVNTVATQLLSSSPTFTGTISAGGLNIDSDGSVLNDISLTFQQTEAQSNVGTLPQVVFKSKTANKEGVIQQSLGTLNIISKDSGLGNYGTVDIFVQDSDASNLTRVVSFGINEHDLFKRLHLALDGTSIKFGNDGEVTITHVHDTGLLLNSTSQLQFGDSGTYIHQSADGVLDLVSDTEIEINATTIDMNGNADVSGTLDVGGALTANAGVVVDNITIDGTEIDLSSGSLTIDVAANIILDSDSGEVQLKDNGAEYVQFKKDSDNVQITAGQQDGDIVFRGNDGGSMITALTLDMSNSGFAFFNGNAFFNENSNDTDFRIKSTGTTNMFYVDASTNRIGIGTDTPNSLVEISDGTQNLRIAPESGQVLLMARDASAFIEMEFIANTFEFRGYGDNSSNLAARIDSSGRVMIGTTDVGYPDFADTLTVAKTAQTTDKAGITIRSGTAGQSSVYFSDDTGTNSGTFQSSIFHDHSGGHLNIFTQDFIKIFTGSNESIRILSGGGITFNGDTAQANALNDYEEGTFTPSFLIGGSTAGISVAHQEGKYTKIGNICHVIVRINLSNKGSNSGAVTVGLPFASANTSGQAGTVSFPYTFNFGGNTVDNNISGFCQQNSTSFGLFHQASGGNVEGGDLNNNTQFNFTLTYQTT